MSGFVGIFHRDGRPIDPGQLRSLTESLRFRGPDGLRTWQRGSVGLGHTLFVTHAARDSEPQPIGLDDRYWIVGHSRLDAREDLISALCHSERSEESLRSSDAALILRAYRAWGPECIKRIHGDFSFGIWDEANQRLFCARDPFGVRPFFYAQFGDLFLFSNTLNCLRAHPRVGDRLYEPALADYLVVGNLLELDRSFFADVRRLPPAHTLTVTPRDSKVERYWTLPLEPELRYSRDQEYIDHFKHVMSQAVADRCAPGSVSIYLSGGLDSATIAAAAADLAAISSPPIQPRALTLGWNSAFADPEPALARTTAGALGLPIDTYEIPDCEPLLGWETPEGAGPEPEDDLYRNNSVHTLRLAAAYGRVALSGRGGDEVFAGELVLDEVRRSRHPRALFDALRTWVGGRRPPLGLRAAVRRWRLNGESGPNLPAWLAVGWLAPLDMPARLRALVLGYPSQTPRSHARHRLLSARWTTGFEFEDAGARRVNLDLRYPFADQRVVRFALRVPVFPWCLDKFLVRRTLRGRVPEAITARAKCLLSGDPYSVWTQRNHGWRGSQADMPHYLGHRVSVPEWRQFWSGTASGDTTMAGWQAARAVTLAAWLANHQQAAAPRLAVA